MTRDDGALIAALGSRICHLLDRIACALENQIDSDVVQYAEPDEPVGHAAEIAHLAQEILGGMVKHGEGR